MKGAFPELEEIAQLEPEDRAFAMAGINIIGSSRYRDSMNDVARDARAKGLMAFEGEEAVPKTTGEIEAKDRLENACE